MKGNHLSRGVKKEYRDNRPLTMRAIRSSGGESYFRDKALSTGTESYSCKKFSAIAVPTKNGEYVVRVDVFGASRYKYYVAKDIDIVVNHYKNTLPRESVGLSEAFERLSMKFKKGIAN